MSDLKNELSWSYSRKEIFEQCRRKYYYRYYLSWGGWDGDAAERSQLAYRFSKMTGVDAYVGSVVHRFVGSFIRSLRDGEKTLLDEQLIRDIMERDFNQSVKGYWKRNPKRYCNFFEDYYGNGLTDIQRENAVERAIGCLQVFLDSPTFTRLSAYSNEIEWLHTDEPDTFPSFPLDGLKVMTVPDLAVRLRGNIHLFDWKTGKADEKHAEQLKCYALYSSQTWGCPPDMLTGYVAYLHLEYSQERCVFTEESLRLAADMIRCSHDEMRSLVDGSNRAKERAFPRTDREGTCKRCSFRELCC